jgi:hypothetical protein
MLAPAVEGSKARRADGTPRRLRSFPASGVRPPYTPRIAAIPRRVFELRDVFSAFGRPSSVHGPEHVEYGVTQARRDLVESGPVGSPRRATTASACSRARAAARQEPRGCRQTRRGLKSRATARREETTAASA